MGAIDGGQPGATSGRIQNVGIGYSRTITPRLVIDADAGYTRQVSGAQSLIDIAGGTFGYITSFGQGYSPTAGARSLQFSGRINF